MSGYSFDANIIIDALIGRARAMREIEQARFAGSLWISRMAWIEVLSKGGPQEIGTAATFMTAFSVDEIDARVADRAAALRRERARLRSPDAIILASAQVNGRVLITRNTRDFRPDMPGIRVPYVI